MQCLKGVPHISFAKIPHMPRQLSVNTHRCVGWIYVSRSPPSLSLSRDFRLPSAPLLPTRGLSKSNGHKTATNLSTGRRAIETRSERTEWKSSWKKVVVRRWRWRLSGVACPLGYLFRCNRVNDIQGVKEHDSLQFVSISRLFYLHGWKISLAKHPVGLNNS